MGKSNGMLKIVVTLALVAVIGGAVTSMLDTFSKGCKNGNVDSEEIMASGANYVADTLKVNQDVEIDLADTKSGIERVASSVSNLFSGCSDRASNMVDMDKLLLVDAK